MPDNDRSRGAARGLYNALVQKEPMERFRLLRKLARWLVPGYRLKWPDMAWWQDPFFNQFLQRFDEVDGLNSDRRWMLYQLARLTAHLPGDTAECGCFTGAGSYLICSVNSAAGNLRKHFVFDSFAGLSNPGREDGDYWQGGDLTTTQQVFENNLREFADQLSIHAGWIPDCFAELPATATAEERQFAFVHIDVDLHAPTLASLEFFYPRLVDGGIILCDDYGLGFCPGATAACDGFVADKPEQMISLSGGSGYLVKGSQALHPL